MAKAVYIGVESEKVVFPESSGSSFPSQPESEADYTLIDTYTSAQTWTAPETGWYKVELFGASGSGGSAARGQYYNDDESTTYYEVASGYSGGGGAYSLSEGIKLNAGDTILFSILSDRSTLDIVSTVEDAVYSQMVCINGANGVSASGSNTTGVSYPSGKTVAAGGVASGGITTNIDGSAGAKGNYTESAYNNSYYSVTAAIGGAPGHVDGNKGGNSGYGSVYSVTGTPESGKAAFFRISRGNTNGTSGGSSQTPISALAVGNTVKLNVNGTATDFIVVQQGLPSSMYDSSCNGTWLLMKDVYENQAWDTSSNSYAHSDIHARLNGTNFLNLFDADIKAQIKQVKLPYHNGNGNDGSVASGSSGLSAKIFLLSGYEVGWTTSTDSQFPVDGACLSYFSGTSKTDSKRIGYYNGSTTNWWLRSPSTTDFSSVWQVATNGNNSTHVCTTTYGIRPALVLPSDLNFTQNDDGSYSVSTSGGSTGGPDEYKQVEYIESTGTQYIDTGFIPNQDTRLDMVVVDTSAKNADGNTGFVAYGSATSNLNPAFELHIWGQYEFNYGNEMKYFGTPAVGLKLNVSHNKNNVSLALSDGNKYSDSFTATTFTCPYTLTLFALHRDTMIYGCARIYSCKIYDNGTIVRDFIPCTRNGVAGLFDKVESKFYANKGTGTFTAGPEVVVPDEAARAVTSMYIGIDNVARKIVKGYIGDENGIARLFWGESKPAYMLLSDVPIGIKNVVTPTGQWFDRLPSRTMAGYGTQCPVLFSQYLTTTATGPDRTGWSYIGSEILPKYSTEIRERMYGYGETGMTATQNLCSISETDISSAPFSTQLNAYDTNRLRETATRYYVGNTITEEEEDSISYYKYAVFNTGAVYQTQESGVYAAAIPFKPDTLVYAEPNENGQYVLVTDPNAYL